MLTQVLLLLAISQLSNGKDPSWFVVNGQNAPAHAWPHQGAIKRTVGGSHVCGCLYFNSQYAITAAHCVDGGQPADFYVWFGTNTIDGTDGQLGRRDLVSITPHEEWTNQCNIEHDCYNHDIALLEFDSTLEVNPGFIEPIPLDTGIDRYSHECYLTGWGLLSGGGDLPDWLQEAPINVIGRDECNSGLGGSETYWNETYQVCCFDNTGANSDGPSGPCYGDSGGPVQCRASAESPWELVGLANWMIGECESTFPSAWTRISYYRDWICEKTGGC